MVKKNVIELIGKFKSALEKEQVRVQKVILYGSWAKGNAYDDSDIDLVVISDSFKGKDYWERIDILSKAIYQVFAPIEAVALTQEEWNNKSSSVCEYAQEGESV